MSKRTQSIRSLFAGGADEPQASGDMRQPVQRVASGAVRSLKDTFSEVERDYEELKRQVSSGALPVDLDTALIDPSPFTDRFAEQNTAAVEALKTSFIEHGQEMPVLVRQHPDQPGRYQVAYGHRRVRAASELGIAVKAYVRDLNDDRLVVAQGIENSAREDLTFIERAMFAFKLEEAGFKRSLVQTALSVDRQEAHKLLGVARAVPRWLIDAIGRAPKVGRPRWQELAELLKDAGAEKKVRRATEDKLFTHRDTDDRFAIVLRAAKSADEPAKSRSEAPVVAKSSDGREIAMLAVSARHCKIQINRDRDEGFATYLMERLPELYANYRSDAPTSEE